jgi:hypothetical protein
MSGLRGTIHLHTDQRPPEAHLSATGDRWCLDLGGDAGGVLPDLTIFGSADQLRSLAHTILAAVPVEGERCGICGATGAHRLGCGSAGGVVDQQQRRARWEGACRKLGMTTTDADWEAYEADDGEGGWEVAR